MSTPSIDSLIYTYNTYLRNTLRILSIVDQSLSNYCKLFKRGSLPPRGRSMTTQRIFTRQRLSVVRAAAFSLCWVASALAGCSDHDEGPTAPTPDQAAEG